MRRRIYTNGKPDWSPNEPDCRGRVSSGPIGGTTAGAFPIAYITPGVERPASHHPVKARVGRRYRAGRVGA